MTAVPASPRISELRELFRNLADFRATYESTGLETISTPYGNTWSLWDLEYLLSCVQQRLSLRQRQAILLCLVHGMRESDAAEAMGVSRSNPVGMYATLGLQRLFDLMDHGELERFRRPPSSADEAETALKRLAAELRARSTEQRGCLVFPAPPRQLPRVVLRTRRNMLGYRVVSPMEILWRVEIGPIPNGFRLTHTTAIAAVSIACIQPDHGALIPTVPRRLAA